MRKVWLILFPFVSLSLLYRCADLILCMVFDRRPHPSYVKAWCWLQSMLLIAAHVHETDPPYLFSTSMEIGGITCNSCGTVPIRGLRYKCANCQDYDLCEGCEAAEVHIKSHVFMKIRIPIPPLANSRTKKLPPFYPGVPKGNTTIPEHVLQELLQKTHCKEL